MWIKRYNKMGMQHLILTIIMHSMQSGATPDNYTIANYDPAELLMKIFNTNETLLPKGKNGAVKFENNLSQYDFVKFEGQNNEKDEDVLRFENNSFDPTYNENGLNSIVKFEDVTKEGTRKKKRRKRKPRQNYYGLQTPVAPNLPFGNYRPYFEGQYYGPGSSRPRPSLASEALTAVSEALTSIALYDDYQCVPRLLCEAAAGGALGTSGILQTISGLQPLLTLLSAYNGFTSNPLFVFGRAVFLGASSNSNPASCRYAYSACPTDPEHLVHYLNNHNGGFFRFFNAPQSGQQNVEQFYNQLSQNYGLYQPNQDFNNNVQNYGYYNPQNQQNYGLYKPGLYGHEQNYGLAYPYTNNQDIRFKNNDDFNQDTNKIEKRIQNKPSTHYIDDEEEDIPRWKFPEASDNNQVHYINNDALESYDDNYFNNKSDNRKGKALKFPGNVKDEDYNTPVNYDRRIHGFSFPETSKKPYLNYKYTPPNYYYDRENTNSNLYNYYGNKNKYNSKENNDSEDGIRTVYVVRGNGDPNKPEVYKLRPGQTVD